jgi:hypothetical protein
MTEDDEFNLLEIRLRKQKEREMNYPKNIAEAYNLAAHKEAIEERRGSIEHEVKTANAKLTADVTAVLAERGKRYGKFTGHSEVTQMLKAVVASALAKRNKTLAPDQQEALDMICHKMGRIINGDADYDDSWVDIAGYAQLVADRLRGVER